MIGPPSVGENDPIAPIRAAVAGRYEIQREIGQGAFATVYVPRDLRHDRDVAFKILNADPTSETRSCAFVARPAGTTSHRFVAVTNWFAELQRLAPAGGK